MTTEPPTRRSIVVGLPVAIISMSQMVELILEWTDAPASRVAIGVNAHVCNLAASDSAFRAMVGRADLLYADGQSIVGASRLLGDPLPERIATTDLVLPVVRACAERGKKVFLLGGSPGVARRAAETLTSSAPGLQIEARDGFDDAKDGDALIAAIREFRTAVLFVGMGDPLQQEWIDAHREALGGMAILSCGGLFDWVSGSNRRAPNVMIRLGLEWLWRLIIEPRRLARRYLLGNPIFIARLVAQLIRARVPRRRRR